MKKIIADPWSKFTDKENDNSNFAFKIDFQNDKSDNKNEDVEFIIVLINVNEKINHLIPQVAHNIHCNEGDFSKSNILFQINPFGSFFIIRSGGKKKTILLSFL